MNPSSLITEDLIRRPKADFAGGYLLQSLGVLPMTWANLLTRGAGLWGEALVRRVDQYNAAGIGMNAERLLSADNGLTLSDEVDEIGVPKARIALTLGENEKAMNRHALSTMEAVWDAAGADGIPSAERTPQTIGTCRMATSGDHAVVSGHGRSFEVPNLRICDNSVFPSSPAANPAPTIMALSLRTADAMLRP